MKLIRRHVAMLCLACNYAAVSCLESLLEMFGVPVVRRRGLMRALRSDSVQKALASGVLQIVATDHAVFNSTQKVRPPRPPAPLSFQMFCSHWAVPPCARHAYNLLTRNVLLMRGV